MKPGEISLCSSKSLTHNFPQIPKIFCEELILVKNKITSDYPIKLFLY